MNPISAQIIPLILVWHRENRKSLPWRDAPTPYHVWISEIMLQQTRIEAVIPYYHRFIAALPDIASLAAVEDERLMKLWEGLGYYSRARNLKKAASAVMESYGGELPMTAGELRKLPGIGDYTAGAIASIAYGQPEPAVDGNVLRVIMRLTACGDDILTASTKRMVSDALKPLYPVGEDARMMTEALMELGEIICTPSSPNCETCPVRNHCEAYHQDKTEEYPHKAEKKTRRTEEIAVFLLHRDSKYAIRKRKPEGLLAGMWEFPNCPIENLPDLPPSTINLGTAKHIFTHVEWHMIGYEIELDDNTALPTDFIWKTAEEIKKEYAIPAAFKAWSNKMKL